MGLHSGVVADKNGVARGVRQLSFVPVNACARLSRPRVYIYTHSNSRPNGRNAPRPGQNNPFFDVEIKKRKKTPPQPSGLIMLRSNERTDKLMEKRAYGFSCE